MKEETSESKARDRLLSELKLEINWQWKWEKKYRRLHYYTILLSWLSAFLILAICAYQFQLIKAVPQWTIFANVFLSMLSVSLPSLSNSFRCGCLPRHEGRFLSASEPKAWTSDLAVSQFSHLTQRFSVWSEAPLSKKRNVPIQSLGPP